MRYILCMVLIFMSVLLHAVPARKVKKIITLADGSQREATLRGDEFQHFLQLKDGRMFRENEKGEMTELDASTIATLQASKSNTRNQIRRTRATESSIQTRTATIGKRKGLVILVNFSDRKMTINSGEFDEYFNKEGYSNYNMSGSVHDYFKACSYGQFDLEFDVIGPVNVSKSVSYYGKNDSYGNDLHVGELICEALHLAYNEETDYSLYDWDGDGKADQVYVIYAGYGEASGAPAYTIWPHEYDLYSCKAGGDGEGPVTLNGITFNTYACSNELYGTFSKIPDGIGTACHEFSHCLGIPDMYDTRNVTNLNFGMDAWDLMDYGCYGNDGYGPVGYTSYERWSSGWLTPIELNAPITVTNMPALDVSPTAYIIYNEANHNEYYLLENRQQVGSHTYDYGHGLLILHVDYDRNAWNNNTVNNTVNRERMTIIPADNARVANENNLAGDPWPGTKNNTELSNTTTPAAKLYRNNSDGTKYINHILSEISEDTITKTISFLFDGGSDNTDNIKSNLYINRETVYNLQGQPIFGTINGLYIKNRKTFINK